MTDDDEGLKPIETEPATAGDEPAEDSLLGIETDVELRTGGTARETLERDDS